MTTLEEALDRVYAAPIDEFTQTRNALAKELKGEDAKTIKGIKKPNLAAWALNQLARRHPDDIERLFDFTSSLRLAQRKALSGGKASQLRDATDARNKIINGLTKLAEGILTESGHGAASSTLAGVNDSLLAIASDDEGAERLRKGRLSRELEPTSMIDVGGLTLVESPDEAEAEAGETERSGSAVREAHAVLFQARTALKTATDVFKQANAQAQRAQREADEAERRAKSTREAAEFARRGAEARKAELDEADQAVATAQRVLNELER